MPAIRGATVAAKATRRIHSVTGPVSNVLSGRFPRIVATS